MSLLGLSGFGRLQREVLDSTKAIRCFLLKTSELTLLWAGPRSARQIPTPPTLWAHRTRLGFRCRRAAHWRLPFSLRRSRTSRPRISYRSRRSAARSFRISSSVHRPLLIFQARPS